MTGALRRYVARYQCHGNPLICCQYVDHPQCNSNLEPHLLGRISRSYHLLRGHL